MRRNKFLFKRFFLVLLLLLSAAMVMGLARQDSDKKIKTVQDKIVQVTGRVRLAGSAPFSELVITNDEREWYIEKSEQQKLWDLQQQIVTVSGRESSIELTFANGKSAGRRYTLKNIKILKRPPDFR